VDTSDINCKINYRHYFILGLSSDINFHFSELKIDNNLIKYRFPQLDFQEFKCKSYGIGLNIGIENIETFGLNIGFCYQYLTGEFQKDNINLDLNNKKYNVSLKNISNYNIIKIKPYYSNKIIKLDFDRFHLVKYFIGGSLSFIFNSMNEYIFNIEDGLNEIQNISNDFEKLNENTLMLKNNHFNIESFIEYSVFFGISVDYLLHGFNLNNHIFIKPSIQYELSFKSDLYNHIYHSIGLGIELKFGFIIKNIAPVFDEQ
jgi:hypothetical protein